MTDRARLGSPWGWTGPALRPARVLAACLIFASAAPTRAIAQDAAPGFVLFTNATIVDGTGAPSFVGDLLIRDGRVSAVGAPGSISGSAGAERRDVGDLVLAPGFIDIHNHSAQGIFNDPLATTQIAQGITTLVVGAGGGSAWPIEDYLARIDALRPAVDIATLVGHGTVRRAALGDDFRRTATDAEIADMATRVERGMREGAFGQDHALCRRDSRALSARPRTSGVKATQLPRHTSDRPAGRDTGTPGNHGH